MRAWFGDTIFALASGPPPAGVAVIRISGPQAKPALVSLSGREEFVPRKATLVRLRNRFAEDLDEALALWFPAPASFTGDDVVELHVHGGRAVVAGIVEAVSEMRDVRPAEAGEFCRRAFENGKLDLTQAEATADLVAAESAAQRKQALRQLSGSLSQLFESWRERLLSMMIRMEAAIDFSDEELPAELRTAVQRDASTLCREVGGYLTDGRVGEQVRDGISVVLIGAPNSGKSTLINALCGRGVSIVDREAGTTRDIVAADIMVGGFKVVMSDTAGLRSGGGRVEMEGVRRATELASQADVRLIVFDGALWPHRTSESVGFVGQGAWIPVVTKQDIFVAEPPVVVDGVEAVLISATTGMGVDALRGRLTELLRAGWDRGESAVLSRERHRRGLEACHQALARVAGVAADELVAEELRTAALALGKIVGRVGVEDVLDGIFAEFCIGK